MQLAATPPTTESWARGNASDDGAGRHRRVRGALALVLLVVAVLLIPVPWLHVMGDDPPATAWRLNGRLYVEGESVDPPGRWSWLAVGRPMLVGELLRDRMFGTDEPAQDLRDGSLTTRPALSEPAAVAVGLRHAGHDVPLRLMVEASRPRVEGLPERVVITEVAGVELTSRDAWDQVQGQWQVDDEPAASSLAGDLPGGVADDVTGHVTGDLAGDAAGDAAGEVVVERPAVEFTIRDGRTFATAGPGLPYDRIDILDLAPVGLDAAIAGPLAELAPVSWWRNLSVGSSHGMMVALLAYADASGHDLAQTRHIAGTGGILGDGSVSRIGGLAAKARAAERAGADVLLFPASQAAQLDAFEPGGMALVPVETLQDAIDWLSNPLA